MSNLIIIAIVVFVLALAAIPAAIRAQSDTVTVTGKVQFAENGKVLHDTGLPAKSVSIKGEQSIKNALKDNLTEKVALDCDKVDVEAIAQKTAGEKGLGVAGAIDMKNVRGEVRRAGTDCAYELRLPARDAIYKVGLSMVGFVNGGPAASKVALNTGLGDAPVGWNLVKNIDGADSPSTGKLPSDAKQAKHVSVKAIGGADVVTVSGGKAVTGAKIAGESVDLKKTPDKGGPGAFRAVPSTVDFAVDITE